MSDLNEMRKNAIKQLNNSLSYIHQCRLILSAGIIDPKRNINLRLCRIENALMEIGSEISEEIRISRRQGGN